MTIHIGWWLLPLGITIVAFVWANWPDQRNYYGYDIAGLFMNMAAIIVSLVVWLLWALAF